MKRSSAVVLVLSGAILQGCSEKPAPQGSWNEASLTKENTLTNNTYIEGRGYYHAPYHMFFPMPYNAFVPGRGYFHGGNYSPQPEEGRITSSSPGRYYGNRTGVASAPAADGTTRGGFTRSSSGRTGGFSMGS